MGTASQRAADYFSSLAFRLRVLSRTRGRSQRFEHHSRNTRFKDFLSGILQRSSASCSASGQKQEKKIKNKSEKADWAAHVESMKNKWKRNKLLGCVPCRLMLLEMHWRGGLLIFRTISTAGGSKKKQTTTKKQNRGVDAKYTTRQGGHTPDKMHTTFSERRRPNALVHVAPQQDHLSEGRRQSESKWTRRDKKLDCVVMW